MKRKSNCHEGELVEVFTSEGGQDFNESIKTFQSLSDRAKATFLFRFAESLTKEQAKLMQKYMKSHSNS